MKFSDGLNERIVKVRKELKLTQKDFGLKLGLARNSIANYESGDRTPSEAILTLISRVYNVDMWWLMEGVGDMWSDIPDTILDELVVNYDLDEQDRRIIKAYLSLDQNQRTAFKNFIGCITKDQDA